MGDSVKISEPNNRMLVALSGGVDSSVAAALFSTQDAFVDGVTLGLWGGERESNSCSTADSDAAQEVASRLGINHVVLDWTQDFNTEVVQDFVNGATRGLTKNPCIACNKVFKAERLFNWANAHGYDKVITGHYASVVETPWGARIGRGKDSIKDQSYVLCGFEPEQIDRLVLPLGSLTKVQVRELAHKFELMTAEKPDSMGLCFSPEKVIKTAGLGFVKIVDNLSGSEIGEIPVGLVAVGQRKGLGVSGFDSARYVVDIREDKVVLGTETDLMCSNTQVANWSWVGGVSPTENGQLVTLRFQSSAHGTATNGAISGDCTEIMWECSRKKISPGQNVVAYANVTVDGVEQEVIVGWGEAR